MNRALLGRTTAAFCVAFALGATAIGGASAKLGGDPAEAAPAKAPKLSNKNIIIVLTRAKRGRLNQKAAEPTLSPVAFSKELGKTFTDDDGAPSAHTRPVPLPQTGNLASGFVAKVDGLGDLCAFALGGLDFTGNGGADGLDAKAAVIMCARDGAGLERLSSPARIAQRLGLLQAK